MNPRVKLSDIIESVHFQTHNTAYYIDRKNGKLIPVSKYQLLAAKEKNAAEDYPEWQKEQIKLARDILSDEKQERYIPIPAQFVYHEHSAMENFSISFENDEISGALCRAIVGQGAFNRFQKNIEHFGIVEDWRRYRYRAMKRIVADWCETNNIEYEEK